MALCKKQTNSQVAGSFNLIMGVVLSLKIWEWPGNEASNGGNKYFHTVVFSYRTHGLISACAYLQNCKEICA